MKPIKMFCLVALAALTAMAFVGASTAMAEEDTALCTADENPCEVENLILHVHETSVGKAKLLTGMTTVECEVLFLGDAVEADPLIIAGVFTYSSCSSSCEVTEENGPAEVEILKTGHETSSVADTGLLHVNCGILNCRYSGVGLEGIGKGPLLASQKNGEASFKEQAVSKESGAFCPSTAKLDVTLTPLSAAYISQSMSCIQLSPNQGLYAGRNLDNQTECTGYGMGNKEWVLYPPGHFPS